MCAEEEDIGVVGGVGGCSNDIVAVHGADVREDVQRGGQRRGGVGHGCEERETVCLRDSGSGREGGVQAAEGAGDGAFDVVVDDGGEGTGGLGEGGLVGEVTVASGDEGDRARDGGGEVRLFRY